MPNPNNRTDSCHDPAIGIIMLDTVFPRIPGDVGNQHTFSFPVRYRVVKGASPHRVVKEADPLLLQPFIEAARELEKQGVKAIATSCGFLAIFHRELVNAVHVPVFSSSLLQVHLAQAIIRNDQKVGILTAHAQSLTERHFASVGIDQYPKAVIGMETAQEFTDVFIEGKRDIDIDKCRREMVAAALQLIDTHTDVGAIILECTNMPPYAQDIQAAVQLPVFDVVTLINYAYAAVVQQGFPAYPG
jgi:Asp/Glu/hydantoin racemase